MRLCVIALSLLTAGCSAAGEIRELERLLAEASGDPRPPAPDAFAAYVDEAVRSHPKVREARARAEAALARARGAAALEDPVHWPAAALRKSRTR